MLIRKAYSITRQGRGEALRRIGHSEADGQAPRGHPPRGEGRATVTPYQEGTVTFGTRSQYQAAIDRAQQMGGARLATPLGGGRYRVIGRRGDRYTVAVDQDGEFSCTCPAGVSGNPCWHQGSAWLKWIGLRSAGGQSPT